MQTIPTVSRTLTELVIACAIAVHEQPGPGFLEAVYQQCLAIEFKARGLAAARHRTIPLIYRGAQVLNYLKLTGMPVGFLMNFNVALMKDGIRRRTDRLEVDSPLLPCSC